MAKKDFEIQPGFEPGSSESSQMFLPTEPLELWHWSRGQMAFLMCSVGKSIPAGSRMSFF